MRPIEKGTDLGEINPYERAQQPLIERLGEYCSYCERWIASGIHVEHKKPKNEYPETKFSWNNFLLACGNCNSGKGHGQLNLEDYLWPDSDNTFMAFNYDSQGRVLPNKIHTDSINRKIEATWLALGLNKHPDSQISGQQTPTSKDKRWLHRQQAWQNAAKRKSQLAAFDTEERRTEIVEMTIQRGFWSVWMTVFQDDVDMRRRLIEAFPGTCSNCFDGQFQPISRPGGQI
ncbi:HNH endonuclease [Methylomonas sp. HYX-M1]|uniref:HNH endonuclease n=1 Tax=Methylomonas sp. HYX-M1 TaxID=3139307 RepID=UPI00345BEE86